MSKKRFLITGGLVTTLLLSGARSAPVIAAQFSSSVQQRSLAPANEFTLTDEVERGLTVEDMNDGVFSFDMQKQILGEQGFSDGQIQKLSKSFKSSKA